MSCDARDGLTKKAVITVEGGASVLQHFYDKVSIEKKKSQKNHPSPLYSLNLTLANYIKVSLD